MLLSHERLNEGFLIYHHASFARIDGLMFWVWQMSSSCSAFISGSFLHFCA